MKKAVVLLSGGLDSSVMLHKYAYDQEYEIMAMTMDYGQLHRKEIECALAQAELMGVGWKYMNISDLYAGIKSPMLGYGDIPNESYAEQLEAMGGKGTVATYVPNRNMLMLSIAAAWAIDGGASIIAYAAHMDDAAGSAYPDCTPEFLDKMGAALLTQGITLEAPYLKAKANKADIVKMGLLLGTDFSKTWSCYKGEEFACGICGTCRDRIAAFKANGAIDPLPYQV